MPSFSRALYEKEVTNLVSSGMSRVSASSLAENFTDSFIQDDARPILSTEEDEDPVDVEQRYELVFDERVPSCIVGLEIPEPKTFVESTDIVPAWKKVLEGLSNKMLEHGIETTRQMYTLSKLERRNQRLMGNEQESSNVYTRG